MCKLFYTYCSSGWGLNVYTDTFCTRWIIFAQYVFCYYEYVAHMNIGTVHCLNTYYLTHILRIRKWNMTKFHRNFNPCQNITICQLCNAVFPIQFTPYDNVRINSREIQFDQIKCVIFACSWKRARLSDYWAFLPPLREPSSRQFMHFLRALDNSQPAASINCVNLAILPSRQPPSCSSIFQTTTRTQRTCFMNWSFIITIWLQNLVPNASAMVSPSFYSSHSNYIFPTLA